MPELPEVEVTRLGLIPFLPGRKIVKITSSSKRLRAPIPRNMLAHHIKGNKITSIDRRAKYLLFRITGGSTMVLHLGMAGKLSYISASEPPAKHDHLRVLLDNTMEGRFNDSRRFGTILVWPPDKAKMCEKNFSDRIGVEPLSNGFSVAYLIEKSRNKRLPIKNFLMDSRIIAGIGNIYANEILFEAALNPETPAGELATGNWQAIIQSTKRILKKAIKSGGSSISDFLTTSGNPGYFQVHFKVYNRGGEKCLHCPSSVAKIVLGGRATYFCPACQPR
jgi:formamidopyrimidine-DNA glycosylase